VTTIIKRVLKLSVPYLGSNCLERKRNTQCAPDQPVFQYPTSGRTAWSADQVDGFDRAAIHLSVPYLGSNCLEHNSATSQPIIS